MARRRSMETGGEIGYTINCSHADLIAVPIAPLSSVVPLQLDYVSVWSSTEPGCEYAENFVTPGRTEWERNLQPEPKPNGRSASKRPESDNGSFERQFSNASAT